MNLNLRLPKFSRAVAAFRLAFLARQRIHEMSDRYVRLYGVAGCMVSGGLYPHWPEAAKQHMRRLNRMANRLDDAGMKARPSRVQEATMRTLRNDVVMETIRGQHTL